jgi:integrase
MPTNSLTDARCKGAKPTAKACKLFDGGGLYLFVTPAGAKVWRLSYRLAGKPKTMSFGPYPAVSLAQARILRDEAKAALREGSDPMAPRRASRKGMTLADAVTTYWEGRMDVGNSYRTNALRGIGMHLLPALGTRNIADITRDDLLTQLNRMDAAGLHVYVRRVRMWVGQVFDWAIEQGLATLNPAALINPKKAFRHAPVESFAALELREVPDFMARLALEHRLQSVLACLMLACTWVRTNELRNMLWSEIDGDTWLIPKGKMKRNRDHVVPLSRQALALLGELRARCRGSVYVFPGEHRLDRPMSENAVLYLIGRIGYGGRMTGHGWRSVASTWAHESGYASEAIEMQLSHAPENKVASVYNRSAYLEARRVMLQAFADWLEAVSTPQSFIPERTAAG